MGLSVPVCSTAFLYEDVVVTTNDIFVGATDNLGVDLDWQLKGEIKAAIARKWRKTQSWHLSFEWKLVDHYLPCGGWLKGFYQYIHPVSPKENRSDWSKGEEGIQGLTQESGKSQPLPVPEKD